jgi:hypothetical protein
MAQQRLLLGATDPAPEIATAHTLAFARFRQCPCAFLKIEGQPLLKENLSDFPTVSNRLPWIVAMPLATAAATRAASSSTPWMQQ